MSKKLRPGYFRIGNYMLEVSQKEDITWCINLDDGSQILGPGFLRRDILVLGSWKVRQEQKETDPRWDQMQPWDQSRYYVKLDDFGNIAGPYSVTTGDKVSDEELGEAMPESEPF